jgi:3-oxoacyl-[acyl-carrier protein] reductase
VTLDRIDVAHYARHFDLNVRGLILASKLAAAAMGDDGGRIVNITSGITRSPVQARGVYSATQVRGRDDHEGARQGVGVEEDTP